MSGALVLNATYEPLSVVPIRRAVVLVLAERAEVLHGTGEALHSEHLTVPVPSVVRLRQGAGFGRTVQVGPTVAGLVGACDGEFSVGQVVGAMAALLDTPVELVAAEVMGPVRELVRDGFLVPVEP